MWRSRRADPTGRAVGRDRARGVGDADRHRRSRLYVTAYPAGAARPNSSVVNTDPLERARAVTVLAPVSTGGLALWRSAPSNVIVDVVGWFTGPSSVARIGRAVRRRRPRRVRDSRSTNDPLHPGGTVERSLVTVPAAAAVINVTAVDATAPGYVSAFPAGMARPDVSMLNVAWRSPLAAMSVVSMSSRGVDFYASVGVHMVVDVAGWFLGAPVPATSVPTASQPGTFVRRVRPVRLRLVARRDPVERRPRVAAGREHRGRTGIVPPPDRCVVPRPRGVRAGERHAGGAHRAGELRHPRRRYRLRRLRLAVPLGFDSVVRAARARGIARVVWLDYRELVGYTSPAQVPRTPRRSPPTTPHCARSSRRAPIPR